MSKHTVLCYLERGDSYLMLHRTKKRNDINGGKWIGIGGHFEKNESPEDCLKREMFEETGLTPLEWRYRGIITFVNTSYECEYMHLFTCTGWQGNMHSCDEGELEWIKKIDLLALPLWQGDRIFLKLLDDNMPFFSLKLCYDGDKLVSYQLNGIDHTTNKEAK